MAKTIGAGLVHDQFVCKPRLEKRTSCLLSSQSSNLQSVYVIGYQPKNRGRMPCCSFISHRSVQRKIYGEVTMTDSPSGFTPIATRSLVLKRPDGRETPIYVAIGAPYRPATLKVTGADGAGCLVLTCDDPDLATEVWGQDEMEALAGALNFLGLYLVSLTEKTCGTLHAVDGSTFDPLGSDFFKQGAEFVAKKAAKKL